MFRFGFPLHVNWRFGSSKSGADHYLVTTELSWDQVAKAPSETSRANLSELRVG